MIEFGKTLREAREAKGLTISQIAESTHLLSQIVEDMENEDFHRISAPIYGRGFVKLYCEAVGLEPKPLVDEFMAILNGERQPEIKMKEVALPPAEPTPSPEEDARQETRDASAGEDARRETRDTSAGEDARRETRDASAGEDARRETRDASERLETPPERQYHPGYARATRDFGATPNFGRLAVLALGAITIVALLVWGGRAIYRISMGLPVAAETQQEATPADEAPAPQREDGLGQDKRHETRDASGDKRRETRDASGDKKTKTAVAPQKPTVKRQPKEVPPLYID